jgi:hypothetical protein
LPALDPGGDVDGTAGLPQRGFLLPPLVRTVAGAGRALLDPRSLASHESECIRSLAAAVWSTADGQPPQVGHRLAADASGNLRRSLASHLPDKPHYADLRTKLRHDVRRSVRTALKTAD